MEREPNQDEIETLALALAVRLGWAQDTTRHLAAAVAAQGWGPRAGWAPPGTPPPTPAQFAARMRAVACSYCGAAPGEPCRTKASGTPTPYLHAARFWAVKDRESQ